MIDDFIRMDGLDPHRERAPAILAAHPEARDLIGRNPKTALIGFAIVAAQTIVAIALARAFPDGWIIAIAAAAMFGAFCNHALYVVVHDATHSVVFKSAWANRLVLLGADLPNIMPGSMAFRGYHLLHHSGRSQYFGDPDIPNDWEARLVRNIWWRKALWITLFPWLQAFRIRRVPRIALFDAWAIANYATCVAYAVGIWVLGGWTGVLYLFASFWFATGPHPLGARWISEHYVLKAGHDTNSYYGPINHIALNIGYHNEHHDFPRVPWNRLPELTAMAPEFYKPLPAHRSWNRLLLTFIFDRDYWLYSRVVRPTPETLPASR
jgi:sphingolipid delta-4 desaturase